MSAIAAAEDEESLGCGPSFPGEGADNAGGQTDDEKETDAERDRGRAGHCRVQEMIANEAGKTEEADGRRKRLQRDDQVPRFHGRHRTRNGGSIPAASR
ncbi:MAG TPA: hypothetical protein VLX85_17225 [Stellaceae bacterium]|nr:hypothetical protein [Stellaceae bacterium]